MGTERIVELYVEGLRCLKKARLELGNLTVLVGDNGTGKSTFIEACQILRRAARSTFLDELNEIHGGLSSLLNADSARLRLAVRALTPDGSLWYEFALREQGYQAVVDLEHLELHCSDGSRTELIRRTPSEIKVHDPGSGQLADPPSRVGPVFLLLSSFGRFPPHPAVSAMITALEGIDVHLPFEVTADWSRRERRRSNTLRDPNTLMPAHALARYGANLANVYFALRNRNDWPETLDCVRLGLGPEVADVTVEARPGGGEIALQLELRSPSRKVPATALSDGTLAFLALVALFRLNRGKSLLAIDEPESHLHPHLLLRALDFFELMADDGPLLLATHSDRLLDGLTDPAGSIVLCELDGARHTRLLRPDPEALARWLEVYRGVGEVRSAGHEASIMTREVRE